MIVPNRFSSVTFLTASTSRSKILLSGGTVADAILPPAALRRISIPPYIDIILLKLSSRTALSSTSVARKQASPPSALISETIFSPSSEALSRSRSTIFTPWDAKYFTIVVPRTPQAPVMTATLSLISKRFKSIKHYISYLLFSLRKHTGRLSPEHTACQNRPRYARP